MIRLASELLYRAPMTILTLDNVVTRFKNKISQCLAKPFPEPPEAVEARALSPDEIIQNLLLISGWAAIHALVFQILNFYTVVIAVSAALFAALITPIGFALGALIQYLVVRFFGATITPPEYKALLIEELPLFLLMTTASYIAVFLDGRLGFPVFNIASVVLLLGLTQRLNTLCRVPPRIRRWILAAMALILVGPILATQLSR